LAGQVPGVGETVERNIVRKILALALLGVLAAARPAPAQDTLSIVAVVNEDVISALDLAMRERMAILGSHLPDTPEIRARLARQVLRGLIDERLKTQEAKRVGVRVSDEEVNRQLTQIANDNKMSVDQFAAALKQSGVLIDTLRDQIRAEIGWVKTVQRRLRGNIQIGDEQIDEALAELRDNANQPEFLVSEIFLSVDQPTQEADIKQSADRLVEQIRGGAGFAAIARQFSQSSTAASGGDLGWVRTGQLDRAVDAVLPTLAKGQISDPIHINGGFEILYLRDERHGSTAPEGKVTLKQAFIPLSTNASQAQRDKANQQAQMVVDQAKSCDDMTRLARSIDPTTNVDLANVDYADLPPELKPIALEQPLQTPSKPLQLATGIGVYMVCQRNITSGGMPSRDQIAQRLLRERLEVMARGYLRDLRRSAFIDLRTNG
jgi:peptidyl-prolyl cis-trans isomerase SurA